MAEAGDEPPTSALLRHDKSVTMLMEREPTGDLDDGTGYLVLKKARKRRMYLVLGAVYFLVAMGIFKLVEGWDPSETSVFLLSILTGCGYGHIIPSTKLGLVWTSIFIVLGLMLFASMAGQILEYLVQGEIEYVVSVLEPGFQDADTHNEKKKESRRHQFVVGIVNVGVLLLGSFLWCIAVFKYDFADSAYYSAVTVLKLDNICTLNEVTCSHGWHTSSGGNPKSLCISALWYVLTYGTIGHFLVAASNFLGTDDEARMTTVKKIDNRRLNRMDKDGDGKVTKAEFLRDRLIQGGLCKPEDVDAILANFEELDKDKSGLISKEDLGP